MTEGSAAGKGWREFVLVVVAGAIGLGGALSWSVEDIAATVAGLTARGRLVRAWVESVGGHEDRTLPVVATRRGTTGVPKPVGGATTSCPQLRSAATPRPESPPAPSARLRSPPLAWYVP